MTKFERAEELGRKRAVVLGVYAAVMAALLVAGFVRRHDDFLDGMWLGVTTVAMMVFLPLARLVRPNGLLARLIDDEGAREHRGRAMAAGFWVAVVMGLALDPLSEGSVNLSAAEAARIIATAAAAVALAGFAVLEMRATR